MANLSKVACELSIWLLLNAERQKLLPFDGKLLQDETARRVRLASWCYLWTFTFPDDIPAEVATKRWEPFAHWLRRTGKTAVRVLEQGGAGKRWHFHVVTPERWSVQQIRPVSTRYGFGRINVKRIPAERAVYVAKYLGKTLGADGPVNVRRWACIGFSGASVRNVRRTITVDNSHLTRAESLCDFWEWRLPDGDTLTFRLRPDWDGTSRQYVKTMELKNAQAKELLADLCAGSCLVIGEYRGYSVRSVNVKDLKSGASIARVVVEHNVEVNGVARVVAEWLPAGANASAVKPVATRGDLVKVTVESLKRFGSQLTFGGTIKPLTQIV